MSTSDVKIARLPTRLRPQLLPQQFRRRKELLQKRNECQPSHCKPQCVPACSSSQRCILDVMKKCGECPVSQCVSLASLGISTTTATSTNGDMNGVNNGSINNNANDTATSVSSTNAGGNDKTGLIAGLTTGLVVGAVIVVAIAGLVYFKRKRRTQQQEKQNDDNQQRQLEERVPTIQNINRPLGPPPAAVVLPATTTLPMDTAFWPKEAAPPSPQSPVFMGNTLQIPRLTTTPSSPPPTSSTFTTVMTSPNTIRQSLSLIPSTATSFSAISSSSSSSSIRPPPPMMNRSSSVKLTKYDHRRSEIKSATMDTLYRNNFNTEEDDEEDRVQLRRAVSVNKKQGLSRSASLGSRTPHRKTTTGEAIPIVYAQPTMVRINTITRKENGVTRKASVRTVISTTSDNQQQRQQEKAEATEQFDTLQPLQPNERRLRTESWNSQHSIANSSHSSVGDGEITVFWDSPPFTNTTTTNTTTTTTTSANATTNSNTSNGQL